MIKYIELKTGHNDSGPAWVARVKLSRSGRTVYFNGKALKRAHGGGVCGLCRRIDGPLCFEERPLT